MIIVRIEYLPESANAAHLGAPMVEIGHSTPESLADVLARLQRRIERRSPARLSERNFTVIVEFIAGDKR